MIALLPILVLGAGTFNIRDYGAVDDGKTLCTGAIQQAIDAASKVRGMVLIPRGTFLSGSLRLKSGVELHLGEGATLLGSKHRKDYQLGQWYALLLANDLHDIAITGQGTIDGHGKELAQDVLALVETGVVKIPPHGWRPSAVDRPEIIEFRHCRGVRVENVTIKNSACWVQTYRNCFDLSIRGIHVDSKTYWNNDGIDVVDCQKVHISDCDVDSDDDGICLKSETRGSWCQDVLIENCKVRSSASAIKFGTGSAGGFRRVLVRHIVVRDTYRSAVALESVDGGTLEDVNVENIKAVNTGNAFFIRLGHRNLSVPPGRLQRVSLTDIDVQVPIGQPDVGYPFKGPPFIEPHNLVPSSIVGHRDATYPGRHPEPCQDPIWRWCKSEGGLPTSRTPGPNSRATVGLSGLHRVRRASRLGIILAARQRAGHQRLPSDSRHARLPSSVCRRRRVESHGRWNQG